MPGPLPEEPPGCRCGGECRIEGSCGRHELTATMNATVDDVMVPSVIVGDVEHTVGDTRALMDEKGIHALPVVNAAGEAVGMVTSADVLGDLPADMPLEEVMVHKVYTIPRYEGVHIAARIMRNHKLHHVVVTEEKRVVGIVSSFDLLQLVEEHRFTMKNPPNESQRKGGRRA